MLPGLASTIPPSISFFSTPRSRSPTLSPARPSSRSFRNASTPVTTLFFSLPNPTSATSSPTFPLPRSMLHGAPPARRGVVAGKLVLGEQRPDLQLHQVQQLSVVYQVALVQEHHDRRH